MEWLTQVAPQPDVSATAGDSAAALRSKQSWKLQAMIRRFLRRLGRLCWRRSATRWHSCHHWTGLIPRCAVSGQLAACLH